MRVAAVVEGCPSSDLSHTSYAGFGLPNPASSGFNHEIGLLDLLCELDHSHDVAFYSNWGSVKKGFNAYDQGADCGGADSAHKLLNSSHPGHVSLIDTEGKEGCHRETD